MFEQLNKGLVPETKNIIIATKQPVQIDFMSDIKMNIFEHMESNVRSYCRMFPAVFVAAQGATITDESGKTYIDFLSGGGALNYGHNPSCMKEEIIKYINNNGLVHGLDLHTAAKAEFLKSFESSILKPRDLDYKLQFTGPTGANAVEAALKLARQKKGRSNIIAFSNSYHGLSLGALAVTANSFFRNEAFVDRHNVSFLPFDGYLGDSVNTIEYLDKTLKDPGSGVDLPAAVIVETVQAEGGINIARTEWLRELSNLCQKYGILLIVDDIQAGIGRTGTFFSFEGTGIYPDIVVLSKSLSGFGLPMSMLLLKPHLDQWQPGEHSGTFRGNNLAMLTATVALQHYWQDDQLSLSVYHSGDIIHTELNKIIEPYSSEFVSVRGKGMLYGLQASTPQKAQRITDSCYEQGLLVEICGPNSDVLKLSPPLTIEEDLLLKGLDILNNSIAMNMKP